jgi:hypothetical protein
MVACASCAAYWASACWALIHGVMQSKFSPSQGPTGHDEMRDAGVGCSKNIGAGKVIRHPVARRGRRS